MGLCVSVSRREATHGPTKDYHALAADLIFKVTGLRGATFHKTVQLQPLHGSKTLKKKKVLTKVGLPPPPPTDRDPTLSGRSKVVVGVAKKAMLGG